MFGLTNVQRYDRARITTISHQAIPKEDEGCEWKEFFA